MLRGGKTYRQHISFKEMIRERDNYVCQECGRPGKDVHHIMPHQDGGLSTPDNLQVLCHSCNCKHRRISHPAVPVEQWYSLLRAKLAPPGWRRNLDVPAATATIY